MNTAPKFLFLFFILVSLTSFSQTKDLSFSATVGTYEEAQDKFTLAGILYLSDGITPAKDYIITINQADSNGDFNSDENDNLITSAVIKTDNSGRYEFKTFIPGTDRLHNKLQEIFMKVETPTGESYAMPTLLFDADPKLTKRCRKQIAKRSDSSRILKLEKINDKMVVNRDMVLQLDLERL
ncbi:protocatechuate 3,4-dioxygenase beta subunit [Winogradskyella wandonensis]|uniref:Protocatechuate 3,4-dioxygenase beta subunit n=1 Tax=Winogradskyella wandonensis TaxID=1442586 RepID=A0A4R1KVS5_9FLAO|nr:hypothetical protein [Winogradskyella wandonensis]TCK69296.1 protocatechuate 3,4-dioxygenase beta subunit [Winogradskyella wandonensis]